MPKPKLPRLVTSTQSESFRTWRHTLAVGRVEVELRHHGYTANHSGDLAPGEYQTFTRHRIAGGLMPCDLRVRANNGRLVVIKVAFIGTSFTSSIRFLAHLIESEEDFLIVTVGETADLDKFPRNWATARAKRTLADMVHVDRLPGFLARA